MVQRGATNEHLRALIVFLEKTARKNKAPIWFSAASLLSRPTRKRAEVNLREIEKSKAEVILVPGKVLSNGNISRKATVAAFSFSEPAKRKILTAGGKAISLRELVELFPTGKNVAIMV